MSEFRRGWPILLGSFIGIAAGVSSIYFYSLGLFLKPVAAEFGWSRFAASLGPLLGTLGAAVASAPTGRLMDRIGARRTAIGASLCLAASFAALALLTRGLASFLLLSSILSLVTVGSTGLSYSRLLLTAFDRHRGLALGLSFTGTGVGAALLPLFLAPYIAAHGWRAAFLALAGIALLAIVPVALLLRGRDSGSSARADMPPLSSVTRLPAFRLLGLIFFLAAVAVLGAVVHFPAMMSDAGVPPARIGALAGSIGLAVIAGRACSGVLLDRAPAWLVTAGFFAVSATGLIALALGGATLGLVGAMAIGVSVGAETDIVAYLVSRLFPPAAYGVAYGALYGLFLLGGALGPALIGGLFDATGTYRAPMLCAAALLITAAALAPRIGRLPLAAAEPVDG